MANDLALDKQLCFALYAASRATTAVYRPILDRLGLTYPQYLVMLVLWERDGRGVSEICAELALDTGTLSPLLKRLGALGLVERRRLAADERRVEIVLTQAGKELKAEANAIPRTILDATQMSDEELAALRKVLVRLSDSLHSYSTEETL
ncbi:MarR family winged helix-turn-helix transcriptional regulator [Antrihabitans cavernicola]|uniref:MarR family transcriptional regulator n=1 Tax=Antrihabitans cavernicola TaxID=2495913 RepID=A0A5A7S5T6_9NOCA|nr:MarR family transcriptional regulator [Spelaeibacter cavernicola]KAA0021236.1 MarR family transcriptional regulator [Spelaeibacter cavernicola]